jgi:hypothetical protein
MAGKRTFLDRLSSLWRGGRGGAPPGDEPLGLEWATYQKRKPELLAHEGQWVVIHGERILGIRPTYEDALRLGYERAGFVDFLVHPIAATDPVDTLPPLPT